MSVAVTDTHALVWYAMGPVKRLGKRALALFKQADAGRATIYVPVLTLVEVAEAIRCGVIRCEPGFARWSQDLFSGTGFRPADLTLDTVVDAESLYGIPERGDRLIAATALSLDCPLITRDPAIARIPSVKTIW